MRRAPIPHASCGSAQTGGRRRGGLRLTRALAMALAAALLLTLAALPTSEGGICAPSPKVDQSQPLCLQADQLLYDSRNNRVIAQGNVEIYYNNFILTADQVVYDQGTNKL